MEIASRSRGTPRIANRLLRRVRDFAEVKAQGIVTRAVADAALRMLDVDQVGFDLMDRKLLLAVLEKFGGGPVGLDNLAASDRRGRGHDRGTCSSRTSFSRATCNATPRGRVAT